jgi:hypothetical protein
MERVGAECGSATLGLFALLFREEKQPRLEISISTDACILINSPRTIGEEEEVCKYILWTTTIQLDGQDLSMTKVHLMDHQNTSGWPSLRMA